MKFILPLTLIAGVVLLILLPKLSEKSFQANKPADITSEKGQVLVGAGDIASCESLGDDQTAKLLDKIEGTIFTLGDNVYPVGDDQTFKDCFEPSWGRHKNRIFPSLGNHDLLRSKRFLSLQSKRFTSLNGDASAYHKYFGTNVGNSADGFYSYNLGEWHIIVLNSNQCMVGGCNENSQTKVESFLADRNKGSKQYNWLISDLAQNQTKCSLAYWHHPRFSSGKVHGSNPMLSDVWQALYQAGTELVLTGHDHVYERLAPLNPSGEIDREKGIRSFVVGTGGKELYGFGEPILGSEVRNSTDFGVLKLTLFPNKYSWEFLSVEGGNFKDLGSENCH